MCEVVLSCTWIPVDMDVRSLMVMNTVEMISQMDLMILIDFRSQWKR